MIKLNEDSSGQEKLIEKLEKKFDNKVLEHIAQQIAIKQVELSTFLGNFENSLIIQHHFLPNFLMFLVSLKK